MDITRQLKDLAPLITYEVAELHHYETPSRHPSFRNYGFNDYFMIIAYSSMFI
jgi:hypothetical protein